MGACVGRVTMGAVILTYILDDETSFEEFIKEIVFAKNSEFEIKGFSDPLAFKSAINSEVQLVILDIVLPSFPAYSVYEMMEYIRTVDDGKYRGINIIVMSGYLDVPVVQNLFRSGADDVIEKSHSWHIELRKAFDRLTPNIILKLNAVHL